MWALKGDTPERGAQQGWASLCQQSILSVERVVLNMEIPEVRCLEVMSHHSQDIGNNYLIINYNEEEANVQVMQNRLRRRLSKVNMKENSDRNYACTTTNPRTDDQQQPQPFSRKEIGESAQQRSLFTGRVRRKGEDSIRVYFFQSDRFREYDKIEVQITMRVSHFIKYIVEDYCTFFLQFTPENINSKTFELRLADFKNESDPNIPELEPEQQLQDFFGETLCLTRIVNRQSNLRKIQQRLPDSEVFQVSIPFQNGNRMFEVPKDQNFGYLIEKVFKACNIVEAPNDFLMVEYQKLLTYDKSTVVTEIQERDFELLKCKPKQFFDEPYLQWESMNMDEEQPSKVGVALVTQLHINEPIRQELFAEVQTSFLRGAMTLSLESCVFIERYTRTPLSWLWDFVCDPEYQKRFSLTTLVSAYAQHDLLILVFLSRKDRVVRKYRISEHKRKVFLSEILRLCRAYKKSLTNPNR